MIIKSIKLENIRSYSSSEINFDMGSTLLSGNIGSGKSTILLAMDFALFGLSKGIITGEALLRHGQKQGSVELNFMIDDKDIRIKRSLKKSGENTVQDSGYLMINGELENLSPVELKQRVLQILNYPQEILTKKSLIYRYTVYTPQEEMKSILLGKKEDRLDTLRKVFNIDKYKRIRENSRILSSDLRIKIKEHELISNDIEEKKKEMDEKILKNKEIETRLSDASKKLNDLQIRIKGKKYEISNIEEKIGILNSLKKSLEINNVELKNNLEKYENNLQAMIKLKEDVLALENEGLKEIDIDSVYKNLVSYRSKLAKIEEELILTRKSLNEYKYAYMNSDKLIKDISNLNTCPVCLQTVGDNHKHNILGKEGEKIRGLNEDIKIYTKKENELAKDAEIINGEIDNLNAMKSMHGIIQLKIRGLNEKKENLSKISGENEIIKKTTDEIKNRSADIEKSINEFGELRYDDLKNELNIILEDEKSLLLNKSSLDHEIRNVQERIEKLKEEVIKKENARNEMFRLKNFRNFIDDDFSRLVETIERKVMLRVHNDFNELFIKWFNMLVDDESISVRLDEEFSPTIEQNGYNTDYLFLSGGEKTAGALAYRLALNQVINNLISSMKTRDLLILDEPTDGFSEDQLDRIRLILDELEIKQIIIVSHESKIESFVNNVIRLNKKEGVSEIL